jgi:hypothetical protein
LVILTALISVLCFSSGYILGFIAVVKMLQADDPSFSPSVIKVSRDLGIGAIASLGLAVNALTVYGLSFAGFLRRAGPVALVSFVIGFEVGAIAACLAMIDEGD